MEMEIAETIRAALARRDSARDAWAAQILDTVRPIMVAARINRLDVGPARLAVCLASVLEASCSQWADHSRSVEGIGAHPTIGGTHTFGPVPDLSFFDGRNHQNQYGRARCGDVVVRPATVAMLAELSSLLPLAVQRLVETTLSVAAGETATAEAARKPSG